MKLTNLTFCCTGHHEYVINDIAFNDGKWHLVELIRNGKDVSLTADRE